MAHIQKKRNWAFVVYPDSAPEDWRERLERSGIPGAISPLHDRDTDATGTPKKAHWHVIVCYPGPTTYSAVKALTDSLSAPAPQPLEAVKGYYRYLTHKDNPEKAQYAEGDVVHFGGFNPADYMTPTVSEEDRLYKAVQMVILEAEITEYSTLCDALASEADLADLYSFVVRHTVHFRTYLQSFRCRREMEVAAGVKGQAVRRDGDTP